MSEVKKEQKAKMPAAESKKTEMPKIQESMMYVGPTIAGMAIQNTVYTEKPEALKEAQKECPELGNLYLPIKQYATAERMIRTKTGYIHEAYKKALEYKEHKKEGGTI